MKVLQTVVRPSANQALDFSALCAIEPNLVLAFGSVAALQHGAAAIAAAFPNAKRSGCSTGASRGF